jgi:hypothetical protein
MPDIGGNPQLFRDFLAPAAGYDFPANTRLFTDTSLWIAPWRSAVRIRLAPSEMWLRVGGSVAEPFPYRR